MMDENKAFETLLKYSDLFTTLSKRIDEYDNDKERIDEINEQIENLIQERDKLTEKWCSSPIVSLGENYHIQLRPGEEQFIYGLWKEFIQDLRKQKGKQCWEDIEIPF